MSTTNRRARADDRRRRAILQKTVLGAREKDLCAVRGEDAVSLVARLTRESWAAARLDVPAYERASTPYRFVSDKAR